jgi:hypothetical protein
MIVNREQRSPVDEEIRLQNASKVMYGNKDKNKDFPFDVRMRFHYVIYHEALGRTEDGQVFSKVSTRRYSFFTPETWGTKMFPRGQKSWFELQGKNFVILHDPIEQAKKEGVKIKGYYQTKTGLTLAEKLAQAVSAESFVTEDIPREKYEIEPPATVEEFIELEDEEDTTPVQKRAAKRKNVKESEVENG